MFQDLSNWAMSLYGTAKPPQQTSIGGVQADYVNASNIVNGHAKSADWGAASGAAIGAYFGAPQMGANIGRTILPAVQNLIK